MIEQKAYRDTWGKGLDSYLKWFYETVVLLRELLADDGSLYVHLDWHILHYAKGVLDEVFGSDNFLNEVIWCYRERGISKTYWNKKHDNILVYTKQIGKHTFNSDEVTEAYTEDYKKKFKYKDEEGRYQIRGKNIQGSPVQRADGLTPVAEEKYPGLTYRQYMTEGTLPLDWWEISLLNKSAHERVSYATQKPEALLERIIKASSNPGDLILDCFCGSGTTAAVAEKLGRRWITCDLGRFAIHTARKRFLAIPNVRPFVVQNLGKYERQAWQTAEFGAKAEAITHNYRNFILALYRAQPLHGYVWLHGVKAGRLVHVGDVAAPISVGDVMQVVAEFKRLMGTGQDAPAESSVDILGWDFAFELNEVAKQQAALAGIAVRFVRIPREVLEKKAVEQGDIKFFELAALAVRPEVHGRNVQLTLTDFVIPLDDVPQEIQKAITHWEQWIDYWAVDWDNKGDTFHNQWQDYRTRAKKTLQKVINHVYAEPGEYKIVVKVIDILGNDTTKTLKVQVK